MEPAEETIHQIKQRDESVTAGARRVRRACEIRRRWDAKKLTFGQRNAHVQPEPKGPPRFESSMRDSGSGVEGWNADSPTRKRRENELDAKREGSKEEGEERERRKGDGRTAFSPVPRLDPASVDHPSTFHRERKGREGEENKGQPESTRVPPIPSFLVVPRPPLFTSLSYSPNQTHSATLPST